MEELSIGLKLEINEQNNLETKKIILPISFDLFREKISKILKINIELIKNISITYKDEEDDIITVKSKINYDTLKTDLKRANGNLNLLLKPKINTNFNLNELIKNFINYKEEINNETFIINNTNEDKNDEIHMNHINENNLNNNNINKYIINENIFNEKIHLTFFRKCNICKKYPIINNLYYCLDCQKKICEKCEQHIIHKHTLLKIQSLTQFLDLNNRIKNENNKKQSKIISFINNWINFTKIEKTPKFMSLIEIAKLRNNLNNMNDIQILQALYRANGDIDNLSTKIV